jgi:hypothetical protein
MRHLRGHDVGGVDVVVAVRSDEGNRLEHLRDDVLGRWEDRLEEVQMENAGVEVAHVACT